MAHIREAFIGVFLVAVAMAAVCGILIARAVSQPDPPAKANRIISFEDQWREAGMVALIPPPKRVTVERVVMPEITIDGTTEQQKAVEPPKVKPRARIIRDVCRGKGRTYFRNGKWRCKR